MPHVRPSVRGTKKKGEAPPLLLPRKSVRLRRSRKAMETNHQRPRHPGFPVEVGDVVKSIRLSLKPSTGVADPRDMKRCISCPRQKVQQIPGAGCPILRAFCEGWDTTNLDTDHRLSHPLPRAQRVGHPPIRGASCGAKHQPRLSRELCFLSVIHRRCRPTEA